MQDSNKYLYVKICRDFRKACTLLKFKVWDYNQIICVHLEWADVNKCSMSMNKSGNMIFELTAWSNFWSNFLQKRRSLDDSQSLKQYG